MATKEGVIVTYDTQNKNAIKPIIEKLANDFDIGGSGKISVNGAEVSNISITGAEVTFQSDTAIVNIQVNPQKLDPQLQILPANLTVSNGASQIVTMQSASDGVGYWAVADDRIASITQISATTASVTADTTLDSFTDTKTTSVQFAMPETANYYSQFKAVPLTVTPLLADVTFQNGRINDTCNVFDWVNGGCSFEGDLLVVNSNQALYTDINATGIDISTGNFLFDIDLIASQNGQYQGIVSAYLHNFPTLQTAGSVGLMCCTNNSGNSFNWDVSKRSGAWETTTVAGSYTDGQLFNLKFQRIGSEFKGFIDDVEVYSHTMAEALSRATPYLTFGWSATTTSNMKFKRIRLYKF